MTTVQAAPPLPTPDPRDPEDRLQRFFDPGSMQQLAARDTSGVLAARGTVSGSQAIAFCTDATVMGGAMGVDGCRHIVDAIDTALRERVPAVGIWHSGGARLAEGVTRLATPNAAEVPPMPQLSSRPTTLEGARILLV